MKNRSQSVPWREAGFTYIETLVSLLVVTLLLGGTALFVRGVWNGGAGNAERALALREALAAEQALRRAAGRVAPPWWLETPGIDVSGDTYSIGYLDGIAGRRLTIGIAEGDEPALEIRSGDETPSRYPLPKGTRLSVDARRARLRVPLATESILVSAPWSGRSVAVER